MSPLDIPSCYTLNTDAQSLAMVFKSQPSYYSPLPYQPACTAGYRLESPGRLLVHSLPEEKAGGKKKTNSRVK